MPNKNKKRVRKLPAKASATARKRAFGKQGALKRKKAVTPRHWAGPISSSPPISVPKRKKR